MKKVLHIIRDLSLGGAETNLGHLLENFSREGFEHHLAYARGGELEGQFMNRHNIHMFKYTEKAPKMASIQSPFIVLKIARYIRKHRIDIVHTHNFNGHFWGVFAAKLGGCKVVEHVHDFRYFDPVELVKRGGNAKLNRFIPLFSGLSDRVIVLTKQNKDFLIQKRYYPEKKISLQPNGIAFSNEKKQQNVSEMLPDIPHDVPIVLTPSRMVKTKNLDLLFRIVPGVLKEIPDTVFIVAGDGDFLSSYKEKSLSPEYRGQLRFIGFHPDIKSLLSRADIFLLPSFLELHSIAILEAMSAGVPVLVSDGVGCNSEFISSWENGVLCDPYSATDWQEAVLRILKDKPLGRSLGKKGYDTCQQLFDIKNVTSAIERIYDEIIRR